MKTMKTNLINGGMNINKIVNQDNGLFSCLKKGDKLTGVISEITKDKVKVDFTNKSYLVSRDKFNDDELNLENKIEFEVTNVTADKTELKKLSNEISNEDMLRSVTDGLVDAKSVFESYDFVESNDKSEEPEKEEENTKSISKNIYEESIKKLISHEDFNIMKISIEEFVEMVLDYNSKMLSGLKTDDNLISSIKDGNDIPKEIAGELSNIISKVESINELNNENIDQIALDFIKKGDYLTLNKIYESQFKVCESKQAETDFDVNEFEDNIKTVLSNEEIETSENNIEVAKKLIVNEIDVTKENVDRFNEIKNVVANLDCRETVNRYIDSINLDDKVQDVCLESEKKSIELENNIKESIDEVTKHDEKLQMILDANKGKIYNVTLMDVEDAAITPVVNVKVDDAETNKLRLELNEIKLMFTAKCAQTMYAKGIDVELAPIKEALNELKLISKQTEMTSKGELLNKANDVLGNAKVRNFAIYKDADAIKNEPIMQIAKLCKDRLETKLTDLSNESKVPFTHNDVIKGYDDNMITSRYTLKGEYNIANRNISELLKGTGIEDSDINKKCAIILSLTGKEVSEDNINTIKEVENKLDYIVNNATPKVVKSFIDEGVDITTLRIDELENKIMQKVEELKILDTNANVNNKEKLVDSICNVLASENISVEVKDALLGIYKVINKIAKYGNAGAGILGHDEDELNFTLREVFDATKVLERSRSGNAINKQIDDAFGTLEAVVESDNNAKKTLDRSFAKIREEINKDSELISSEDINKLAEFAKGNEKLLNKLYDDIEKVTFEQIKVVKDFEDSKKLIKDTVLASSLISNSEEIKEEVNKIADKMKKETATVKDEKVHIEELKKLRDKDAEKILERYEEESGDLEDTLDVTNRILSSSTNELMRIESINKVLRLAYANDAPSDSNMQVPVLINDELTNINLIFDDLTRDNTNEVKILISIDLPNVGEAKVDVKFDKEKGLASFDFLISDKDAINEVVKSSSEIINMIEDAYHVSSISINGKNINTLRKETNNLYLRNKKIN